MNHRITAVKFSLPTAEEGTARQAKVVVAFIAVKNVIEWSILIILFHFITIFDTMEVIDMTAVAAADEAFPHSSRGVLQTIGTGPASSVSHQLHAVLNSRHSVAFIADLSALMTQIHILNRGTVLHSIGAGGHKNQISAVIEAVFAFEQRQQMRVPYISQFALGVKYVRVVKIAVFEGFAKHCIEDGGDVLVVGGVLGQGQRKFDFGSVLHWFAFHW